MTTWAIRSGRLLDGTGQPAVSNGIVVVQEDKIVAAGSESEVTLGENTPVVDVGGRTMIPGLIDAHVHMLSTGGVSSGEESRAMNNHEALLQGAQNNLMAIRSGLTAVRDCGDRDFLSLTLRDSVAKNIMPGPRMVCSGPVITSTAGQLWWDGIECDTTDDLRRAVRTLVKNGVDFIKLMGSGGERDTRIQSRGVSVQC